MASISVEVNQETDEALRIAAFKKRTSKRKMGGKIIDEAFQKQRKPQPKKATA